MGRSHPDFYFSLSDPKLDHGYSDSDLFFTEISLPFSVELVSIS